MALRSLKGKLIVGVSVLVIGSGLLLSLIVTQHYSKNLHASLEAQAKSLAQTAALEAAEKILINDVVSLQKLLENQMRSNSSVRYLFVQEKSRILAHTFPSGIPKGLINANSPISATVGRAEELPSTTGERFLDIAWPIFDGKAGVLRLGISKTPFEEKVRALWLEMGLLTLIILLLSLAVGLFFVRRITRPLGQLANAAQKLDEGSLDFTIETHGTDEVAQLATSFNGMVARIKDFTMRLEDKTHELERSHDQTRAFCEIVREIGSLPTLEGVCTTLLQRIVRILRCSHMALLVLNDQYDKLYVASQGGLSLVREQKDVQRFCALLDGLGQSVFLRNRLTPPLVPDFFKSATRQAIIPLENDQQIRGALAIACPGECACNLKEIDWVGLILSQSAGVVRRAVMQEEAAENIRRQMSQPAGFRGMIGKDPKMQAVYSLIEDIACTDASVLIQGESGTGKELVARAIHIESDRRGQSFAVINCSAYPETLLESELFGHEKGAFTGAVRTRKGRFEQADGGTVFLDEIGEISSQAQIRLLRVLQTQTFERVGADETLNVNVRIIAATNKDLAQEVEQGNFREDLYFRLNVIPMSLPPLRDRRNDIPALAMHFLRRFSKELGKDQDGFSSEAMRLMLEHDWPGNVRELENSVEHAVVLAKRSQVDPRDLPAAMVQRLDVSPSRVGSVMKQSEKATLERVLEECGWNKKEAARRLGIGRTTLYTKLKKHGIAKPTVQ